MYRDPRNSYHAGYMVGIDSCRDDGKEPEGRTYEVGPDEPYSVAIVCAVADASDTDPMKLPELLCDAVAVDAMESMFADVEPARSGDVRLSFLYCGFSVTVAPQRIVLSDRPTADQ